MTFSLRVTVISQDRSQGQSSNLCFSCFFLASAHLRKSQAVCLVERCVAGPHRAESEINLVPLKSCLCKESPQQLLHTTDLTALRRLLGQILPYSSVTQI